MPEEFGPASVQYDDYTGTAAADEPHDETTLYRMAGIDRREWTIVGIELGGGEGNSWAWVFAIPTSVTRWDQAAAEHDGSLPVTRFEMPGEWGDSRRSGSAGA